MMGLLAHGVQVGTAYKSLNYLDPGGLDQMNLGMTQAMFS